ncbi:MAG: metallophosphoesterase family protein [Kiritimatiellae bacterium]|nr:metallophosphoesterase family protein [Kiritimatiellia bacterium]
MRYAIISDIHANAAALRTVLVDAQDMKADRVVCLGDVLGYGPDPVQALETVYSRVHVCLAGNHDDAVCGRCSTEDFNEFAASAVVRQRKALTSEALAWLGRLPYVSAMDGFACAHGDFTDPEAFNYILDPEDALPSFEARAEQLMFVGHTHQPGIFVIGESGVPHRLEPADFVVEDGKRYIVNVGSVGYPRSGLCRSFYCIYDDVSRAVFFRSLPFDLEGYREKMGGKGLDEAPWVVARARERAVPQVRGGAKFGKAVKVKTGAVQVPPPPDPPRRHALPVVLAAALALAAGAALAIRFGTMEKTVVRTVVRQETVTNTVVKEVVKQEIAPSPVASPVRTETLELPWGTTKVFFSLKLAKGSVPARAHIVFKDAKGAPLRAEETTFDRIKQSLTRSRKGRGIAVPQGAVSATVEVGGMSDGSACEIAHLYFSDKEEGKDK